MKDMKGKKVKSYLELERECESLFLSQEPIWHLYTPGESTDLLFTNQDDFVAGMNMVALSALDHSEVKKFTFELMNNHIHSVIAGEKDHVIKFFDAFKKRLSRYLLSKERYTNVLSIKPSLKLITDLKALRAIILYVNRNGYVINPNVTPFSYPWGANMYYFNPGTRNQKCRFYSEMTVREKRTICKSHKCDYPGTLVITNGYISPLCYCDVDTGEKFFRDAHHYFTSIVKSIESYSEIAKELGDKIYLNDNELFSVAVTCTNKKFGKGKLIELNNEERLELAKTLYFDYSASNKQISRILRLDQYTVDTLFPKKK